MFQQHAWPPELPEIREALDQAYSSGDWGRYHGQFSEILRTKLTELVRQTHIRLCASGTIAVELALRALGVEPGHEVILGGYDFPGNFRSIEFVGAIPVLVDLDPVTGCIDPSAFDAAVSKKTKAIIATHLHSGLADMPRICGWGEERQIPVIEDACQAPGAIVSGRPAGSWGDISVLSFGGSKLLTAGRGGALAMSRDDYFQRLAVHADRGNDAFPLSELQAAVLTPQIDYLETFNQRRRNAAMQLRSGLDSCDWLESLPQRPECDPSYYKFSLRLNDSGLDKKTEWLARMQSQGILIDQGFRGFTKRSQRRCRRPGDLSEADQFCRQNVVMHHTMLLMESVEIDHLVESIIRSMPSVG